jgi:hypothetical protein
MTPGDRPRPALVASAGLSALAVYAFTLAPSLGFVDSGELAAAAHSFGIPHPTGYPLFVWLAGAWSRLPIGTVIFRLNLFCAIVTALAAAVCVDLMWRLLARARVPVPARSTAALAAALLFALNRTVWSGALSLEVYALHALLLLLVLDALARAREGGEGRWRWLAFALGLAFANHLTTVQLLPGLLLAVLLERAAVPRPARWPGLAGCFVLGLLPYASLPLRAAQDPLLNWGEPRTLPALLHHVSGAEFRERFFMGPLPFLGALRRFALELPEQSGVLTLALACLGALAVWRSDRRMAIVLGAWLVTSIGVAASYTIPDIDSYFLLAVLVVALLAGHGVAALAAWSRAGWVGPAAGAAAVAALLLGNRVVSERGNYLVQDFAENMFRSLEPRAIVVSYQWDHWVSPALYLQGVEGLRPDVLVIDKRLCRREWYVRQLCRRNAEACRDVRAQLDALLESASPERVNAFLQALIDANSAQRPIYVTVDVEPDFPAGYRQVPTGLALRLFRPDALPSPEAPVWDEFRYRPFPRRNGWTDRLRQYYSLMLVARGDSLEQAGHPRSAARYYERALGFEPSPGLRAQTAARLQRTRSAPP